MHVGGRDVDRQRDAVLVDAQVNLDAVDLLAAIEAPVKQLGADLQDRLSMTTALGSAASPQASRHVRRSRSSRRRHSPSRVQRANRVNSVLNGMSQSWPMARHCMPQKHRHQIAMIALRSADPVNAGFGPERVGFVLCLHGREFRQHLIHEGIDVTESIPGGRRSLGGSDGGTHMLLARRLLTTVPDIARQPPKRQPSFSSK